MKSNNGLLRTISGIIFLALLGLLSACGGGGGGGSSSPAATAPGAPTAVTATAGNSSASVAFTAPASNGGTAITSYTVTSSPGSLTGTGSASPITVTGLTNGTSYTFTVTATNSVGTGAASAASNAVTPTTVPGAPTAVSAAAGNAMAQVSFTAPADNGGSAITGYTVISSPAGGTDSNAGTAGLTHSITGLTNGTAYTFTVTATNTTGTGLASTASTSVVPTAQTAYYVNGTTGLDTNAGSMAAPFKTITAAVNAAAALYSSNLTCGITINIAPGTYTTGETFPINVVGGVSLVGDIASTGTTTVIQGTGSYTYSPAAGGLAVSTALTANSGCGPSSISGLQIKGGSNVQVVIDTPAAGSVTLASNTIQGALVNADGVYIEGNSVATLKANAIDGIFTGVDVGNSSTTPLSTSNATLSSNTITGNKSAGLNIGGTSTVNADHNSIAGVSVPVGNLQVPSTPPAILVTGGGAANSSPTVILGSSAKLPLGSTYVLLSGTGGNTITGPANSVGLSIVNDANAVNAAGNTWHANVQGADANGNYVLGTAGTNPSTLVGGNNYAISGSASLAF